MSSNEIHLIEYEFSIRNPTASSNQVSEHLLQRLFQSLVNNGVVHLLDNLCKSLDSASINTITETHERETNAEQEIGPGDDSETGVESLIVLVLGSEEETFRSLAEGMLKASSSREGVRFLQQVLDFCTQNDSKDERDNAGATLWQHLRSVKDKDGYSPLHRAVILGFRQIVKVLVRPTCDTTSECTSGVQLPAGDPCEFKHFCVGAWPKGHALEFADFDIIHSRTLEGWTPLHFAAILNPSNEQGIVEGSREQTVAKRSFKPVVGRGVREHNEAAKLVAGPGESDVLDVLLMMYENIKTPHEELWDFADNFWMTPLHYAVLCNRQGHVKQLLGSDIYGRHVNAGDYHQKTPLHMAVCHQKYFPLAGGLCTNKDMGDFDIPHCSIELIRTLAECSKVDIHASDCCWFTPLHWAAHVGNLDVVRCFLSLGNGIRIRGSQKDYLGRTAMQVATERAEAEEKATHSNWVAANNRQQNANYFSRLSGKKANQRLGSQKVYEDIQWELLTCKDVRFDIERLQREKQGLVDGTNAMIVASALVAGAAFQGLLQPPFGEGSIREDHAFRRFLLSDYQSFCFSIAALMFGIVAVFPNESRLYSWLSLLSHVRIMLWTWAFLITSIFCLLMAITSAGYVFAGLAGLGQRYLIFSGAFICLPALAWSYASIFFRLNSYIRRLHRNFLKEAFYKYKEPLLHMVWDPLAAIRRKMKESWIKSRDQACSASESHEDHAQIESFLNRSFKVASMGSKRDHPLDVLKKVYEEARKETYTRSKQKSKNIQFLSDSGRESRSGVIPREIHFWMPWCPLDHCRAHSLRMDQERWRSIVESAATQVEKSVRDL